MQNGILIIYYLPSINNILFVQAPNFSSEMYQYLLIVEARIPPLVPDQNFDIRYH